MAIEPVRLNLGDPFRTALLFLGHSWDDNGVADHFYLCLKSHFRVWYDRSGLLAGPADLGLSIGQPTMPLDVIPLADFIIILISDASMRSGSSSREELDVAMRVARTGGQRSIGLIRVPGFQVPIQYTHLVYAEFSSRSSPQACSRLGASIRSRLAENARLVPLPGASASVIYQCGSEPDALIAAIGEPGRRSYALNAVFRSVEKERLIAAVNGLTATDKQRVVESLVEIYLADHVPGGEVARQNAVFLVSRLAPGRVEIADEVRRRYPDANDGFLYRGFHLGLGYLEVRPQRPLI